MSTNIASSSAQFSKSAIILALITTLLFLLFSYFLAQYYPEYSFGFIAIMGAIFGIALQRSRFCFYCIFTDFFERRDLRGILGLLVALLVGALGYHAVFGAFLPVPDGQQLPPDAHIGAISWILPISSWVFGFGMAMSGSCISAQLYRLGEGLLTAPVALLGVLLGFALGFISWNPIYLALMQDAKPLWLPNELGYAGSLLLQVFIIGGLIFYCLYKINQQPNATSNIKQQSIWSVIFQNRWPTWVGGVIVGIVATVAYFRVGALGVTAELGSIARTTLAHFWEVSRLEGIDRFTGCMTIVKESILSNNGVFVISLVIGSFISALIAGQFKWQVNTIKANARIFVGGILMGWGAMLSLGCTVGVFLSGIMASAVSGWVFAIFCTLGAWVGWYVRRSTT